MLEREFFSTPLQASRPFLMLDYGPFNTFFSYVSFTRKSQYTLVLMTFYLFLPFFSVRWQALISEACLWAPHRLLRAREINEKRKYQIF